MQEIITRAADLLGLAGYLIGEHLPELSIGYRNQFLNKLKMLK